MSYALESLREILESVQQMREEGESDLRCIIYKLKKAIKDSEEDENS